VSRSRLRQLGLYLYKIWFDFEAFVHETSILSLPPPTCKAYPIEILLYVNCALHDAPRDLPCVCHTLDNTGNNNIV